MSNLEQWRNRDEVAAAHARKDYLLANIVEVAGPLATPCWEWQRARKSDGYGNLGYKEHSYLAHRLFWIIYNNPIPEGFDTLHRCDNPPCGNPAHLFLGTDKDNVADSTAKGRRRYVPSPGERNGQALLSNADVANIKGLLLRSSWCSLRAELARRYGVSKQVIHDIATGKRWAQIEPFPNPILLPLPGPPLLRGRSL
jgi:HNH endonuclease